MQALQNHFVLPAPAPAWFGTLKISFLGLRPLGLLPFEGFSLVSVAAGASPQGSRSAR